MAPERDVTKKYPVKQFIQKIRRLADGLENGEQFTIQIDGTDPRAQTRYRQRRTRTRRRRGRDRISDHVEE
jgi:hypothetical protein